MAEVLITLGIIGIVAAMTMPTLMNKINEKRTITHLKEVRSILAQAMLTLQPEYGSPGQWAYSSEKPESVLSDANAILIADMLKKVIKVSIDCGVSDVNEICAPNLNYKLLNGSNESNYNGSGYYKMVLLNGASLYIRESLNSTGNGRIVVYTDVNGKNPPNTFGRDMFQFSIDADGIVYPIGDPKVSSSSVINSCNLSNSGFGCAYYVLQNNNMDYLYSK